MHILSEIMKTAPTKRENRKLLFKNNILKCAEGIFLEKGYSLVTTDEIAARAGVTVRTLYKYFPSKLALYISMFDHYLQQMATEMAAAGRRKVPSDRRMTLVWDILYEFTKRNEKFMRLYWMLDSKEYEGEIPEDLIRLVRDRTSGMFAGAVRANDLARQEDRIIDVDPFLLAHLMSAVNKGIFIHVSKERRLGLATPSADDLNGLLLTILQQGLYKRPGKSTR
jgi:AcrR family transcriptional regulator